MQAPQPPSPHPSFVPVRPRSTCFYTQYLIKKTRDQILIPTLQTFHSRRALEILQIFLQDINFKNEDEIAMHKRCIDSNASQRTQEYVDLTKTEYKHFICDSEDSDHISPWRPKAKVEFGTQPHDNTKV